MSSLSRFARWIYVEILFSKCSLKARHLILRSWKRLDCRRSLRISDATMSVKGLANHVAIAGLCATWSIKNLFMKANMTRFRNGPVGSTVSLLVFHIVRCGFYCDFCASTRLTTMHARKKCTQRLCVWTKAWPALLSCLVLATTHQYSSQ